MTTTHKFSPGDRVIARMDGPGVIVKAAKATALVRLDRGQEQRIGLNLIRPETAEDVAKREHAAAMQAWRARCPKTKHARVEHSFGISWGPPRETGASASAKTPDDIRAAAAELLLLADWFAERPVGS